MPLFRTILESERRKMFGYPCAFVAGNLFTGLHQENVIVRLAERDRVAAIGTEGARLFEPMSGAADARVHRAA